MRPPTSDSSSWATPCSGSSWPATATSAIPDFPEGMLAKVRSAVVNARVLAQVAERPRRGRGPACWAGARRPRAAGPRPPSWPTPSRPCSGAVYLDAGWDAAELLVLRELRDAITRAANEPDDFDHKSRLQEKAVRDGEGTPRYVVVGSGPDHERAYEAEVFVAGTRLGDRGGAVQEGCRTGSGAQCLGGSAECLSCPKSRRCARTCPGRCRARRSRRCRWPTAAPCAGTPRPSTSARRSRAGPSSRWAGWASTCC